MNRSSLIIVLLLICVPAWGATYYVDATGGNDSNAGTDINNAWKTISKVNGSSFSASDSILFKKGETWREELDVTSSGSAGSPITFSSYGTGALPIISGADIISGFTAVPLSKSSSVYQKTGVTIEPHTVIYNGTALTESNGSTTSVAYNKWDWASNVLYINVGDPTTGVVEAGIRPYGILSKDRADYINIDGLNIYGANVANIIAFLNNGWTIKNNNIWGSGNLHLFLRGNQSGAGSLSGILIDNNTLGSTAGGTALYLGGLLAPIIRNNTINIVNGSGININSGDFAGGGASGDNAVVYGNTVTNYDGMGIVAGHVTGTKIYNNYIHDGKGLAISSHNSTNTEIYYNVIHTTAISTNKIFYNGIDINESSVGTKVYNNTVVGVAGCNLTIETRSKDTTVKNNILDARLNSISPVSSPTLEGSPIYVSDSVSKAEVTLSNNALIPRSGEIVGNWQGIEKNLAAWQAASGDTSSVTTDPKFVSISTQNFSLQSTSPAINAGTYISLTTDYAGNSIQGLPDIGAYEYQGKSAPSPPQGVRIIFLH